MKLCNKCNIEKPIKEFSARKLSKDGLAHKCKACASVEQKAWRAANPQRTLEAGRAWRKANPDKAKASLKAHKEAYPEKHALYQKRYREKNPKKVVAATRKWQIANPERVAAKRKEWCEANPDKVNQQVRTRRARKMQVAGSHTIADVRSIFDSQRGLCASCEKKLFKSGEKKFHIDHIKPLARGGSDDKYNLQCLCPDCNQRKHAKDPLDWARENGKLL